MKRNVVCVLLALCFVASGASAEIIDSQRSELGDGIAHYTFDLAMGPGEFDRVRLHRVVEERFPFQPATTATGVLMLPGAPNSFEAIFMAPLISPVPDWDHSVAVFLAKNGIDVWGMDYRWVQVPMETDDFGFMEHWGLAQEVQDTREALSVIRSIRTATGQGDRRLHLLGFSYGVPIAYGLVGVETQLPPGQRLVKGLVAVDYDLKVDAETQRSAACEAAARGQARILSGVYQNDNGVFFNYVGSLADEYPEAPSPFSPPGLPRPFTNFEFALFAGALHDPWHFVGGQFDPFPYPTGLRFTDADLWVDVARSLPFYVPIQALVDINLTLCDEVDVPFDDHLAEITIPILALGAAGGGAPDPYTPSLTASRDVEWLTVQLLTPGEVMFDFGHADLFLATDAEALVWQPLLDWLVVHRENQAR